MIDHEYICNGCNRPTKRSMLTVKKILFTDMGEGSKTSKARVVAWLCPPCVAIDLDWNREPNVQPSVRADRMKVDLDG